MKYIFLSEQFYKDYDRNKFPEIEHKHNRPYVMLLIQIEELKVACICAKEKVNPKMIDTVEAKKLE